MDFIIALIAIPGIFIWIAISIKNLVSGKYRRNERFYILQGKFRNDLFENWTLSFDKNHYEKEFVRFNRVRVRDRTVDIRDISAGPFKWSNIVTRQTVRVPLHIIDNKDRSVIDYIDAALDRNVKNYVEHMNSY